jgi:hypothetical protein
VCLFVACFFAMCLSVDWFVGSTFFFVVVVVVLQIDFLQFYLNNNNNNKFLKYFQIRSLRS